MDTDGSGSLSCEELQGAFTLGQGDLLHGISQDKVARALATCGDDNGDGKIDYFEFCSLVAKLKAPARPGC
jgi:Ca2+-binding EF-hand superfamily protein